MATSLATAYISLVPSMSGAQGAITKELGGVDTTGVGKSLGTKMGNGMAGSLKSLIGPAIALAGAVGVGKFVADSVKSLGRIEEINTQTATALKSTGAQAWTTSAAIEGLAGKLEDLTGTEAESIQKGANLMLTFKNVQNSAGEGNDIFDQSVVAMTDMARAMGTDVASGAVQLGKALNDPIKGVASLSKVGITFSADQKAMIASLVETNDLAGAQKIILGELNSQFGGSAAAYAETYAGRMELLGHAVGTFGEAASTVLMPALKSLAIVGADTLNWAATLFGSDEYLAFGERMGSAITGVVDILRGDFTPAVREGFGLEEDSPIFATLHSLRAKSSAVTTEVSGGFTAMVAAFKDGGNDNTSSGLAGMLEGIGIVARDLWDVLGPVVKELGPQIFELVTTMSPLGLIFKALQPVLPQIGDALGKVATALSGALAAVLPIVVDLVGTLVDVLSGALASVLPVIAGLLATVATVVANTLVAILPVLVPLIELVADVLVALMPPIAELVGALGGALSSVLLALMPTIVILAGVIAEVLTQALDALLPIFPVLVDIVVGLLGALMPLVPAVLGLVNALLPLIPPLLQMTTALFPVLLGLIEALLPVILPLVSLIVAGLVIAVDLLSGALEWVVEKITGAIDWFGSLSSKGTALKDTLGGVWDGIKSGASSAWNWIRDNVFAPFSTGISAIGTAFDAVSGVVAAAWDLISSAASDPVNFIIETVYTGGIKKLFDTVAEKLGLSLRLPVVNPIGKSPQGGAPVRTGGRSIAMWTGGVLPGYTPGRDVHEFSSPTGGRLSLSGGEAIMRPEFTRAMGGPAGIARINAMFTGGAGAGDGQSFWGGGVWDWVKEKSGAAWDFTKDAASAAANFMKDPIAGALEVISKPVLALLGGIGGGDVGQILAGIPKAVIGSIVDSAKSIFGEPRAEGESATGPSASAMGVAGMTAALRALIPGARVTSGLRPGAKVAGTNTLSMHGAGRAIDIGSPSMAIFNALLAAYPNATELLYSPAGARQRQRGAGGSFSGDTSGVTKSMHYDHVHWGMKAGGVWPGAQVYDNGGWLPPGGVAVNLSDRPEPIFSADQWESIDKGESNSLAGRTLILRVGDREFTGYVEDVADTRIASDKRDLGNRRGYI